MTGRGIPRGLREAGVWAATILMIATSIVWMPALILLRGIRPARPRKGGAE